MTIDDTIRILNMFVSLWSSIILIALIKDAYYEVKKLKTNAVAKVLLFLFITLFLSSVLSGIVSLLAFLSVGKGGLEIFKGIRMSPISRIRSVTVNVAVLVTALAFWQIKKIKNP